MLLADKKISLTTKPFFAYNVWSIESAKAVIDGCAAFGRNVVLQTSMKAYNELDQKEFRDYLSAYALKKGIRVLLHLDHCKNLDTIEHAISNGWDSVMIDASDQYLEDNIRISSEVCGIAHEKSVLVEAEIGQINGINGVADYDEVCHFLDSTDIDMLAVAIGTAHGLYHGVVKLDMALLEKVDRYAKIPLVVHGGSGLSDDTFVKLFSYSKVKKINISTEVKQAYRKAIIDCEGKGRFEQEGFDPIVIGRAIHDSIYQMVTQKEMLFERV